MPISIKDTSGNLVAMTNAQKLQFLSDLDAAPTTAVSQAAYIDFTTKSDGTPPSVLDTGQPVTFVFAATGRKAVISGGRLVVENQSAAGTGGLADYYQASLGLPVVRVGVEWTMPPGADDGNGNITYAAWDGIYSGSGSNVPKSWVHMSIVPGTGAIGTAKFFVCNGVGNLFVIKQQTFVNPASDGSTRWACESYLDVAAGAAYSLLPDGSVMTCTDADIAYMCGVLNIAAFKFSDLASRYVMCEHFCSTGANAARFGGFTSMWGDTLEAEARNFRWKSLTPAAIVKAAYALKLAIPPTPVSVTYAPTTALSIATTASAANVDATNGRIQATVGPSGKVIFQVTAYYEWSAGDVLFWRLAGTVNTPARAADVGVNGQKRLVTQTIEVSGRTPGETITETLQHWSATSGSATCKAGGSGGGMLPPITILAIPA